MSRTPFRLSRRDFSLALMATGLAAPAAWAQAKYPDKPVRVILPFGAGGVADVTARLVAQALSEKLGQNFVIENMPGAGGITAARAALSGGTDGYTLTLLTNGTAISVPLFNHLPFDPRRRRTRRSAISSKPPRKSPARSMSAPSMSAARKISPPNCSRPWPASTW
jgi:tripartite-type tricarboxylate transporter receptor subunit TctC